VRPDRFRKLVARRCAQARHDAELPVAEVAARLKIHVNDVHRVEAGDQPPSAAYLAGLADAAEVSADYLLGRSELQRPWDNVPTAAVPAGLLRDALLLSHPDRHPAERQEQATRVSQELNALLARRQSPTT
jgi:transcriptional regulator with XRE-family HTH domain